MIFQNPRAALNPIRTVGLQLADALRAHRTLSDKEAREKALELLKTVLIREPESGSTPIRMNCPAACASG